MFLELIRLRSKWFALLLLLLAHNAQAVKIVSVEVSKTASGVTLGGTVIPYKEVALTAQSPGRIEFLLGEEGDRASQNQLLAAIGNAELLAQRNAALAQLTQAEVGLRDAQMHYSKELWSPKSDDINQMPGMAVPSLFDKFFTRNWGSMSGHGDPNLDRRVDLFSQGTQVSQAQAGLTAARANIAALDARLRDAQSIAPFDGVILKKLVELGDTVQPGQALLVFAQTEYLRIKAEVPARLVAGLRRGMFVPARLDVGDVRVNARVAQIYPQADQKRHTVTVKFDLPRGIAGGPGMYAEVTIPDPNAAEQSLLMVSKQALIHRGSLPYVFVMTAEGASLRIVRVGNEVDADYVEVLSGLKEGDRVVVDPPPGIVSGWKPGGTQGAAEGTSSDKQKSGKTYFY